MTLAMLADSGLPKSFWWDAWVRACCDTTCVMPTRTCRGWMSPAECVPDGRVPNLSRLRRWGCKGICLSPLIGACAGRTEQWKVTTLYSKTKIGYCVLLGDTVVPSVHVLLDKSIPERSTDYFRELDEATLIRRG